MDSSSQSVRVTIFGDDYSVKGDVNVETTKMVAEYVNRKMTEIRQNTASSDKLKIAILSALNIAGELLEQKSKSEACENALKDYEARIQGLAQKIERAA